MYVFCDLMCVIFILLFFFFQAEDGIRDLVRSRGLGDVYKRQGDEIVEGGKEDGLRPPVAAPGAFQVGQQVAVEMLSLIHI